MRHIYLFLSLIISLISNAQEIDSTFGDNGNISFQHYPNANLKYINDRIGNVLQRQIDGKLIVGTDRPTLSQPSAMVNGRAAFISILISRYLENGNPDSSFGENGISISAGFGENPVCKDLKIQDDVLYFDEENEEGC